VLCALFFCEITADIYFWLTYRLGYLKFPAAISFERLKHQFGGNYQDTAQGRHEFKRQFMHQLKKVLTIYPSAKVTTKNKGLLLQPGLSHIKTKRVKQKNCG
jgi:hypothetical protein